MSDATSFLRSLSALRDILTQDSPERDRVIDSAYAANQWFTPEFTRQAMQAIADEFLDEEKCAGWLFSYPAPEAEKTVAIIMAGNLPLVGFHDLFCTLASGHRAMVKLSEKDNVLLPWVTAQWINEFPQLASRIIYTGRLEGYDAVIATGSNNSSRYFEYYFRAHPHILRGNRNGVAVLTGQETMEDLQQLAFDVFLFFGFGCRNVSRIFLPAGFDMSVWNEAFSAWKHLEDHNKYKNNLEYNFAIFIINSIPHINLGQLILKEDEAIASRIGCLHYSYYADPVTLHALLNEKREEIQCVITKEEIPGWEHVRFGESQRPRLHQYADGVDTMQFLSSL
jgi:hypothetical protein